MNIKIVSFDELPAWVNRDFVSHNGSGAEYANYILIEDGQYRECYSDAMEPEDARFTRDLGWIVGEIKRAQELRSQALRRLGVAINHIASYRSAKWPNWPLNGLTRIQQCEHALRTLCAGPNYDMWVVWSAMMQEAEADNQVCQNEKAKA